ncbi:MAG: exopolyphosphatase [Zetaproteobacteria bacterium CG2_30_46_52]|nr:MAG: exopolyphosphatase [Zetaproteobacteria bacterium CG2_30_46_52]
MEIRRLVEITNNFEEGALIAAIDVGSNAMRMGIATFDATGNTQMIQRYRAPVRLGHDAFTTGKLSEQTMDNALEAFHEFRGLLDQHHITKYKAIATSAMRDASNGKTLIAKILQETNIELSLISGEEEARLVQYAISQRLDLSEKYALLIDMGGGSVEISLTRNGKVLTAQSFQIGTVRLLEMQNQAEDFALAFQERFLDIAQVIKRNMSKGKLDFCVATGGNAAAIGELAVQLGLSETADSISRTGLGELITLLNEKTFEERISELGLRPDRADVIVPAAMVFHQIMKVAKAKTMMMPDSGLLDGILLDLMDSKEEMFQTQYGNLIAMGQSIAKKFHVDRKYAEWVNQMALLMFDLLSVKFALTTLDKLLLQLAASLHEMGMYINVRSHHHQAAYLITAVPMLGLSDRDKQVLSQVLRYQRKAAPSEDHADFASLSPSDKKKVWQLSALLRLAIALNRERRNRVSKLRLEVDKKCVHLMLNGAGELLLERWAAMQTADYFEKAFDLPLQVGFNPSNPEDITK